MRLTPCPSCKRECAPNAKSCPACGHDFTEGSRNFLAYLLVIAGPLAALMYHYGVFERV